MLMLPMSALAVPSAPLGALITARFGPRKVAALGLALMGLGLALLTQADTTTPYWWMAISFAIIAIGSGFAIPSGADLIVGGAPVHLAGVASGFQTTCIQIGGAIGTAVLSAIVAAKVGPAVAAAPLPDGAREAATAGVVFDGVPDVGAAFIDGLHTGLTVAAAFCVVVAVLVMVAVREPRHHDYETVIEETVEGAAGHL
jgi:MFS family permease